MKRVELKRIAEFLWKATPNDEKTPFAQGTVPDNGSISKNLDAEDNKKPVKEFPEDESEKNEGPMSIPRKLCFVMSFNVLALYFLALAWLIPCRNLNCDSPFGDIMEINLTDYWPLTNVETLNVKGLPSLAMLGYADGEVNNLAVLDARDGESLWNNSLLFIPRKIQCNFEITFDANGDGIGDCLLTGFNEAYAFNASNGYVFWQQNLICAEGNIACKFHTTQKRSKETYLIGSCGDKLVILNALNGTRISAIPIPCRSPMDIRIVPSVMNTNFTFWSLVCDYGDKIEAWAFGEQDVLNVENLENTANATEFALLFSGSDSGGSIALGCDVTTIPGGPLLLSWADRVVMVTPEATAWERHFPYPVTVADIEVGHFTNSKELQIAAAVRNESDSMIYILEIKNGSVVDSIKLEDRQAQTMHKVSDSHDFDSLVLKSISLSENTSIPQYNFSDPVPTQKTNFALVEFSGSSLDFKEIISTSYVVESTVNLKMDGESDLLVLKIEDGQTSILKLVLHRSKSEENLLCFGVNHHNHYTTEI